MLATLRSTAAQSRVCALNVSVPPTSDASPRWHVLFLSLIPAIQRQVKFALRRLPAEARECAAISIRDHFAS